MRCARLSWLIAFQLAIAPMYAQSSDGQTLNIAVLDGEGAINNLRLRSARNIMVEVRDENKRPLAGAAVVFTLPSEGPSGSFGNGQKTVTAMTDKQGVAVAHGLRPNSIAGKLEIRVNTSHQQQTARATITEFNMLVQEGHAAKKSHAGTIAVILILVGAAGGGGAYAALRNNGSHPSTAAAAPIPAITITPGSGTIGPPQ